MVNLFGIADHVQSTAGRVVSPVTSAILDFLYPPVCLICGREANTASPVFCGECVLRLKPTLPDECPRCGAAVGPYSNLSGGCGQCRDEKFSFDRVIRLGIYENAMRQACLRAKASDGSAMARGLASLLIREKRNQFAEMELDLVMPVPEHWTRRLLHSHYAAETISREISRQLKVRMSRSTLSKRYRTPKQATSTIIARRKQQSGSFCVSGRIDLKGKNILLVDDILTTGSTASAAARELKQAGARTVAVAVISVSPLRKVV